MKLKSIIMKRAIVAFGKRYGYDVSYMLTLLDTSPRLVGLFRHITAFADCRRKAPVEAFYVAKLVAMLSEDCGPCLKLTAQMAKEAGVSPDIIRGAIHNDGSLPPELAEVREFAWAVASNTPLDESLRLRLETRLGREAVAELALGIAGARVYPAIKRGLGYAQACQLDALAV